MQRIDGELILSATDLSKFLGCRHLTALDMSVAFGGHARYSTRDDPVLDVLKKRGEEHEKQYVDSLRSTTRVVDLSDIKDRAQRVERTAAEMRAGTPIIVQGALRDGLWFGYPDVMARVEKPSALGAWSYEIEDTKLARETRAGTMLQLGLYSEMLAIMQQLRPEMFRVVTPHDTHAYRVDDYAAYFRYVRERMLATVTQDWRAVATGNYPDPVAQCEICGWVLTCKAKRRADDHVSLVANITRMQRRELAAHDVKTVAALAALALPIPFEPKRGSRESYVKVREQARLQVESRDRIPPLHELLAVEKERGFCRLPEPSEGDLFLDLEGDQFAAEGGREYLFGVVTADGAYHARWAFTDADERLGFEWVMDMIADHERRFPDMHVYHYAHYEQTAFKRLMGRYATRERELDAMLRGRRFVDLYAVVRQGLRAGIERYSIKNLEALYGFARSVDLRDANRMLRVMEQGLEMRTMDVVPDEVRETVLGYNRDDCVSTLALRNWLEGVRAKCIESGTDIPRPDVTDGAASEELTEKAKEVEALRARLLVDVPDDDALRTPEQSARWLLAFMLDYHRREDKAVWWEFFRLRDMPALDLHDERNAIAGMQLVERVEVCLNRRGAPTGKVVDRYAYPPQEMEIGEGCKLKLQDQSDFGEVAHVDRINRLVDVLKPKAMKERHPTEAFEFTYIRPGEVETSLTRIGQSFAAGDGRFPVARALLEERPPNIAGTSFEAKRGESETARAVRLSVALDHTVLAIQGPPGSGKTYTGAKMICRLIKAGKKVGVTANSHKVIRNFLTAIHEESCRSDVKVLLAHKNGDEHETGGAPIGALADNDAAIAALQTGEANVVGGTAWLWAREDMANSVDVLFVDEAGQMALPNVVAVSQAANSVVLLGDPRQLEQPIKGSHPPGVDASALEHIIGADHRVIPPDRGIFLAETWRLAPSVCAFTSELFYENKLTSHEGLERQHITVDSMPTDGLLFVPVAHDANRNWSSEEIEVVAALVGRLVARGTWTDRLGVTRTMEGKDILVVSPYNAQVTRLGERLADTGVQVGTVDKFQGREAPVVIYSMATSTPEDAPRGMEFLYSLNRLNVATSRAKCLAIVVASQALFEVDCHSPRQMHLANALCRFREMAATLPA